MKKIWLPLIMILAVGIAFFEQSRDDGNLYIQILALIIFMYCMMRLSAKTPSKNQPENDSDV